MLQCIEAFQTQILWVIDHREALIVHVILFPVGDMNGAVAKAVNL